MSNSVKITVVGDGIVGKTCMLSTYTTGEFPAEYVPTVFEHYGQKITVDDIEYDMTLWDTAGQEDYERLRPLSYPHTNCFLVCFSVDKNLASYDNVTLKWVPEVRHFSPNVPIVIVATKIDLRNDPSLACYTPEEGKKLKRKVRAQSYMECSALANQGLEEVFVEAIRVYRKSKNRKPTPRHCILL
ncbi:ras-like GTP-binding protein RhoL [Diorhabda carinulata]|uniref:ras-like GTP-binding protein RhoL n=1 Tax=Diorhabda sublineata TaxID=1163346 RepID=UPI0024E075CD|nr:ras-like GTP-binding protein RhoL [Diorhabda sublineata]XP_056636327.1 ras-like GTP-binding protein RhoL [Diorhabda sublineata]XP_056636328.1 ras-like GTP-binding protein RhoL [Diorhabda sublineata]XP_057653398.1 ras-like GTP-binding protein RhoL [Diorhabda carinulata]XP_057653399.1 ras-like GTP-binding protein RhoL [Diorhabda carinulata]XP_057653400.1 ras-like GTP-binding protein RhoL [Diorhabda carinulata]